MYHKEIGYLPDNYYMSRSGEVTFKPRFTIGLVRCSDMETIPNFFDKVEEDYPNFKEWLMKSCYDRFAICLFDDTKIGDDKLVGIVIYSNKPNCKYYKFDRFDGRKIEYYKISTFIINEEIYSDESDIDISDLKTSFLCEVIDYIISKSEFPCFFYTTIYEKSKSTLFSLESTYFKKYCIKEKTGESVYIREPKY